MSEDNDNLILLRIKKHLRNKLNNGTKVFAVICEEVLKYDNPLEDIFFYLTPDVWVGSFIPDKGEWVIGCSKSLFKTDDGWRLKSVRPYIPADDLLFPEVTNRSCMHSA